MRFYSFAEVLIQTLCLTVSIGMKYFLMTPLKVRLRGYFSLKDIIDHSHMNNLFALIPYPKIFEEN